MYLAVARMVYNLGMRAASSLWGFAAGRKIVFTRHVKRNAAPHFCGAERNKTKMLTQKLRTWCMKEQRGASAEDVVAVVGGVGVGCGGGGGGGGGEGGEGDCVITKRATCARLTTKSQGT